MGQNCYLSLGFDIHVFHPELSMFPAYATLRKRSLGDFVFGAVGLRLVHWGSLGAWWHRRATPRLGRASPGRAPPSRDTTERGLAPGDGLSA